MCVSRLTVAYAFRFVDVRFFPFFVQCYARPERPERAPGRRTREGERPETKGQLTVGLGDVPTANERVLFFAK